jgi:hypothetical protein
MQRARFVGEYYTKDAADPHGFLRAPDGAISSFDVSGAKCGTYPYSINRKGVVTGIATRLTIRRPLSRLLCYRTLPGASSPGHAA